MRPSSRLFHYSSIHVTLTHELISIWNAERERAGVHGLTHLYPLTSWCVYEKCMQHVAYILYCHDGSPAHSEPCGDLIQAVGVISTLPLDMTILTRGTAIRTLSTSLRVCRGLATLAYDETLVPGRATAGVGSDAVPAPPLTTAIVVHGLFGSGRNWRTPSKSLADLAVSMSPPGSPGWRVIMVDLRCHGKSDVTGFNAPHDIASAARDLVDLVKVGGWEGGVPIIIGHSLGGKIALEYARVTSEAGSATGVDPPEQVWVLDSLPGKVVESDVEHVLKTLKALPNPIPSKRWLLHHLADKGYTRQLAEWLGSSLKPTGGATSEERTWLFDVEGASQLYQAYKSSDYMPFLRSPPSGMRIDLVKAERSDRWQSQVVAELAGVDKLVGVHVLPDAGHWVHVDNPKGLVEMLAPSLVAMATRRLNK